MRIFQIIALTPPGFPEPSIAIAASRAGAIGILDVEYTQDVHAALAAISKLSRFSKGNYGVKLASHATNFLEEVVPHLPSSLKYVILTYHEGNLLEHLTHSLQHQGRTVYLETTSLEQAQRGEQIGVDGVISKGHEAGGYVGDETTFILLQQYLHDLSVPVFAHGGIGLHTVAACRIAGAAGVILDAQLTLARESTLPDTIKNRIALMDGSETICLGGLLGEWYRVYSRPDCLAVESLRQEETRLISEDLPIEQVIDRWHSLVHPRIGWDSIKENILPIGQDAAFALMLAKRYLTVGGIIEGIRRSSEEHCKLVGEICPFDVDGPLAQVHGTRYPIVQGPMTRVSDVPGFAKAVADGGGLPFLALALMRGNDVDKLLDETKQLLGDQPWGVGILGFVPLELRQEQLEAIRAYKPPYALIAGGRPDQARVLEKEGIPTYLHVPSPGLLEMFLKEGARHFVFEGRECGGHVGPRSSFVLWESMIEVLLEHLASHKDGSDLQILFAGGIHDAMSAAMVAAMAAPLAKRGVRLGTLVGTGYIFTEEAVATGAIVKGFQEEIIRCERTALLETGPGHSTRCAQTPYTEFFERERKRLYQEGKSADEIRYTLEELNLGRLRIASKGITRHPEYGVNPNVPKFIQVDEAEQKAQGMYMIGQVAVMRDQACTIEELHQDIAVGSTQRLQAFSETYQESVGIREVPKPSDIAIIGMSALFPKAPDLQTYWENILNKVYTIMEIPTDRWSWELYYDPDPKARDKCYSKWGAFLDDVVFEPTKYGMPPNTLASIEPMQLLALEVANAALEDAGYTKGRAFPRERTSVYFGAGGGAGDVGLGYGFRSLLPHYLERAGDVSMTAPDFINRLSDVLPEWTEDSFPGILLNVISGRIANRLDLGGTNFTVDAACAASMAAVALGAKELESGDADMVIVGGADTMQNPYAYMCFSKTMALSPTGEPRTFDETGDGIVIGEGIAAVVLKRLADAERDGDPIYAVIKGVGSSSDGKDKGLTAPRPEGQVRALERAYAKAGFSPATVQLIEAHGTGTVVGDRTEVESLKRVFDSAGAERQSCAIGSVKSMIGHTKCTAGVAGLIKVALALHHKVLPPTLGVKTPNSKANFSESPFYINTETRPWLANDHPRRAGASAFGFGGTNFHVVLEEYADGYLNNQAGSSLHCWPTELFLWRRDSRQGLIKAIEDVEGLIAKTPKFELKDLAYTIHQWENANLPEKRGSEGAREGVFPHTLAPTLPHIPAPTFTPLTLAWVATSVEDFTRKLARVKSLLGNPQTTSINDPQGIYFSEHPMRREGKLAFLFPGQGSQYVNMLRDLTLLFPEVREHFEAADQVLREQLPKSLSSYIFPQPCFSEKEEHAYQKSLTQTNVAQPAMGVADMAMYHLLGSLGVHADLMAGHSYGEYVALCAAGVFDFETLISLSEARGRFIVEGAGAHPGTMAAIEGDEEQVQAVIRDIEGVCIANLNAPRQTIITGVQTGVEGAIERFKAKRMRATLLPVACAFHSESVAPACDRLAEFLRQVEIRSPQVQVFSNTTAELYPHEPDAIAKRLVEHLVHPVEFVREIEGMYAAGARLFVEVGPRNVLTGLANGTLSDLPRLTLTTDQPKRHGLTQLHHLLGQLAAHGVPVTLDRFYEGRPVQRLDQQTIVKGSSPTAWVLNGTRARPISMRPKPLREAEPRNDPAQSAVPGVSAVQSSVQKEAKKVPPTGQGSGVKAQISGKKDWQPTSTPVPQPQVPDNGAPMRKSIRPQVESRAVDASADTGDSRAIPTTQASQPTLGNAGSGAQIMVQFQQVMNRFLDTQRHVMLAYLQANRGMPAVQQETAQITQTASSDQPVARIDESAKSLSLSEAKERIDESMNLQYVPATAARDPKDTPVVSPVNGGGRNAPQYIKSEEDTEVCSPATSLLKEDVAPAATDVKMPAATQSKDLETWKSVLLQIVSERTGYPVEMLEPDLDLEADLGIDSIKRIEILGNFQEMANITSEAVDMENLASIKTLRGIIAWMQQFSDESEGKASRAAASPIDTDFDTASSPTPSKDTVISAPALDVESQHITPLPRYTLQVLDAPLRPDPEALAKGRVVLITDDERGTGVHLSEKLRQRGYPVALVRMGSGVQMLKPGDYTADFTSFESVSLLAQRLHKQQGPVAGVIHLLPLKENHAYEPISLSEWRTALRFDVKSLFYLAKVFGQDLNESAGMGGACFLAVSAMGGDFASTSVTSSFSPGHGGIAGLTKTLAHEWVSHAINDPIKRGLKDEWPLMRVRVVDVSPQMPAETLAEHLLQETFSGDEPVEVGYQGDPTGRSYSRLILYPVETPLDMDTKVLEIDRSSVLLITGGARGITSEIARELATRYQPTLLLVGRSPLPDADPPEMASLQSAQEIKAALIAQMRQIGQTVTPAMVEKEYIQLCKNREIRENIEAMKAAGAQVCYFSVDVRDEFAFGHLIDEIYETYGKIDGVLHGAGIIEDKLVRDKTPESFDRVFDTKVESAFILSRKLRPDSLKFLFFFSSVAGRFGNRGQGDYAAANEVYNKLAIWLDERWPARVVSVIWGPWEASGGTDGMVSQELQKQFAQHGIQLVPRSVGPQKLVEEIEFGTKGTAEVILGGGGWAKALQRHRATTRVSPTQSPLREETPVQEAAIGRELPVAHQKALPLMDSQVEILPGTNGHIEIFRELDPAYDRYLQDHVLDGKPVLPMAMALELAAEAAALGWPEHRVFSIRDMRLLQGIVLENGAKTIRIRAEAKMDQTAVMTIADASEDTRIHYRAIAEFTPQSPIPYVPLELTDGRPFPMTVEEAYRRWLFHGRLFRGIQSLEAIGTNGIIASLRPSLPQDYVGQPQGTSWLIDPLVVDSALQLLILWTRAHWDVTNLPSRIGSYKRFAPITDALLQCQARIRPETTKHLLHADIALLGQNGHLIGFIEDVQMTCSRALNRLAEQVE